MKMRWRLVLALAAQICASSALAAPPIDCPSRDEPFSIDSPLLDILLSSQARSLVESSLGSRRIPAQLANVAVPTFAAIVTLRSSASSTGLKPDELVRLDTALRAIPVGDADKNARCARYDVEPPQFSLPPGKPRVLLFEKITGFRDDASVAGAHGGLLAMAARKGWAMVSTDKGAAFTPNILKQFDVVIWNNISGDVLTLSQRRAFRDWLEQGGAFVGLHGSAGDPVYFWDWYQDSLIGARFIGHPMSPQFQDARVVVDSPHHPITAGLPHDWVMKDEWYSFGNAPRVPGVTVIATLDETSYNPMGPQGKDLHMGDHPIAWTRCIGKGRVFYSAIGHRPESYSEPHYVAMLEGAVTWAASDRQACPGK